MTKKILFILALMSFSAMAASGSMELSKEVAKEPPEGFLKFREP